MTNILPGSQLPNDWGIIDGTSLINVKIKAAVFIIIGSGAVTFILDSFKTGLVLENKLQM